MTCLLFFQVVLRMKSESVYTYTRTLGSSYTVTFFMKIPIVRQCLSDSTELLQSLRNGFRFTTHFTTMTF